VKARLNSRLVCRLHLACACMVACCAASLSLAACSPAPTSVIPAEVRESLRPVPMPDIASAAAPVQVQLREQHASLVRLIDDLASPQNDLAAGFGRMGTLFLAAELFGAAEASLANAHMLAPMDMRWPYFLGHVYRLENESVKAATFFQQSLSLFSDHVPSLVWLAEMHLANGQASEALPQLVKAQIVAPKEAAVLYGLGRVALETGDYAQAVSHLEQALTLSPGASRVHYPLAMAYRGTGDRARADAHLRQRGETDLVPADPLMGELAGLLQNAAAYETRGAQAIDARRWTDAVTELQKAIELSPGNAFTRLNLGTALYQTGRAAGALDAFQTAVRLSPGLAKAHYAIGVLKDVARDDEAAIASFSAAVTS
jgi:Flp pilus assembly protein TadD